MSNRTRDDYRAGVPWWVTTIQPDVPAATAFYGELFGWEHEEKDGGFTVARLDGRTAAAIAPLPAGVEQGGWVTQVLTDDADETARRVTASGGTVLAEPFEEPAGRITVFADPHGAVLAALDPSKVADPVHLGAEAVNEAGAYAMSQLASPDPDAAVAFYGEVFGWTAEAMDFGGMTAYLLRLPGYVGGEPQQPVSREVVAVMLGAQPGQPPSWNVDFWVWDVPEALAQAERLGARVLMPATQTPNGHTGVLMDPGGAVFSVTTVTPVEEEHARRKAAASGA